MSKRFYGDRKIETAQEDGDFVILNFNDGILRLPKKLFEVSVSKESLNPTDLWDRQIPPVVAEVLQVLLSWDVKLEQLDYVITMLKSSVENSLAKANTKLWGMPTKERRMSDVDKILLKQDDTKQN